MKIEVFCLCDAATDYRGKLNLLGTFDQLYAPGLPVRHPACAIALRMRFTKMEEGEHQVQLQLVDPDGQPVSPTMDARVHPRMPDDLESLAVNMVLNLQHLQFDAFADYQVNLSVDGVATASLPLRVRQAVQQQG